MLKKIFLVFTAIVLCAGYAAAGWVEDALKEEAEKVLKPIVRDFGLGISAGMNTRAGSLSFPGVEIAARMGMPAVSDDNDILSISRIPVPFFSIETGLPGDFDIYGRYMSISVEDSKIDIIGGGLRYSFMQDKYFSPMPAVSATAGMNRLSAEDITITATTIGLAASKKFFVVTPYAGVSYEMFSGEFKTEEAGKLKPTDSLLRFNIGSELNLIPALFLGFGLDITSESNSGLGFHTALGARISL